jgi:predicted RNA-binding Zn ribbon-like protein
MERQALLEASVQPGGRPPAPGALELVQAFVNTVDREWGPDLFAEPAGLGEWLARRGLLARGVLPGEADARRAVELREALRALLLAHAGAHPPAAAAVLERAAGPPSGGDAAARARAALERAAAPLRVRFDPDGAPALVPAATGGVEAGLARIVAVAVGAMLDGSWERLKACPREVCGWAFYDRSPNRAATWCSMAICGSREKASTYYRRRQTQRASAAASSSGPQRSRRVSS